MGSWVLYGVMVAVGLVNEVLSFEGELVREAGLGLRSYPHPHTPEFVSHAQGFEQRELQQSRMSSRRAAVAGCEFSMRSTTAS